MKIQTRGRPDKVELAEIRQAAVWYAHRLMGPRLAKNIQLKLVFKQDLRYNRNIWAECGCKDPGPRPRKFVITMDAHAARKTMLLTLAHEMTHVKQFARRELIEIKADVLFKWYGEVFGDEVHYYETPWEIEAHGREIGLYYLWRESVRLERHTERT
jgi:hypothetical protein